ncbi:MAG: hypothetical protein DSY92_02875, partial [Planctomycetota bacterium]
MTHRQSVSLLSVFLTLFSCQGPPPRTVVPVPSLEDRAAAAGWHGGRPWMDQHLDGVKIAAQGNRDLLLVGDSITQSWGGEGRRVGVTAAGALERFFGQLRVGNLGISGDQTVIDQAPRNRQQARDNQAEPENGKRAVALQAKACEGEYAEENRGQKGHPFENRVDVGAAYRFPYAPQDFLRTLMEE